MNTRHRKTLAAIFASPISATLPWKDIEALFRGLGADIGEGSGSRMRVKLKGERSSFHRPHPRKEAGRLLVQDVRDFLTAAGVTP